MVGIKYYLNPFLFFHKLLFICFNLGKLTKNDNKTIQLSSSNFFSKSKTKSNSNKMLKDGGDLSNNSDDEIIKVNNSETRRSQVLFVGNILSKLKFCFKHN